jgi:hypothetical protein
MLSGIKDLMWNDLAALRFRRHAFLPAPLRWRHRVRVLPEAGLLSLRRVLDIAVTGLD